MKKITNLLICLAVLFLLVGCNKKNDNRELKIVTTIFPAFDFARAIVGSSDNIELLLSPGSELHTFEPTPKDIIKIEEADIFIYNGGESDEWVEDILNSVETKNKIIIKMTDSVSLYNEEHIDGMDREIEEEKIEIDEHVWTSPKNAIKIVSDIKKRIIEKDNSNKVKYEQNSASYIEKLNNIDKQIRKIVESSERKILIFGDRFPLRYFVEEYDLNYYAAFPGCSSKSEPSAKTISYLIDKIKKEKIPVVLYLELSNQNISKTLSNATGTKTMEFSSIHNITKKDFNNNLTYIDIMNRNIEVLKEALN